MTEHIAFVNDAFVPESRAHISILDHAVLYGDGVFETVAAWNGRIFKLDAHIDRFFRSMTAIALQPPVSRERLKELVIESVKRNELRDAYIKWIATRGSNGTPLMDPTGCTPNLIILVRPYVHRTAPGGFRVKTVAVRRPPGHVLDAHIKSLNYLNLVLAKVEAKAAGADQALMLDIHGRICESPGFNVFVVNDNVLRTPRHDILVGITRETVMDIAPELGFSVHECDLELYDAYTADEIFLCSTAGGLLPVVEVDGRLIAGGKAGPSFTALAEGYHQALASERYGTPIYDERSD